MRRKKGMMERRHIVAVLERTSWRVTGTGGAP
jgi:hypothetical protein